MRRCKVVPHSCLYHAKPLEHLWPVLWGSDITKVSEGFREDLGIGLLLIQTLSNSSSEGQCLVFIGSKYFSRNTGKLSVTRSILVEWAPLHATNNYHEPPSSLFLIWIWVCVHPASWETSPEVTEFWIKRTSTDPEQQPYYFLLNIGVPAHTVNNRLSSLVVV